MASPNEPDLGEEIEELRRALREQKALLEGAKTARAAAEERRVASNDAAKQALRVESERRKSTTIHRVQKPPTGAKDAAQRTRDAVERVSAILTELKKDDDRGK
jgi:hypothetical protein